MRALPRALGVALVVSLIGLLAPSASAAEEPGQAAITHIEASGDQLGVVVAVPAGADVDLDGVSVTVAGRQVEAAAAPFDDGQPRVRRTTVLAIDTSNSMAGERFEAAKGAATTFLAAAPADVRVGIVSFADRVVRELEPTQDREAARRVIDELSLSRQTMLYDGVLEAVAMTGDRGQRSVLVLSDGRDTSDTELDEVTTALTDARVLLDVVTLQEGGRGRSALTAMAEAGSGQVISATSDDLEQAFASEADALSRQIQVTAGVPADAPNEASVEVTLPAEGGALVASALGQVRAPVAQAPTGPEIPSASPDGLRVTDAVLYAGVAAIGLGLLVILAILFTGPRPAATSLETSIAAYGMRSGTTKEEPQVAFTAQAKEAAANVLQHSGGLEARIAARLEGAGSAMKPAEWILIHGGLVVAAGFVGLLISGFNPVVTLLFLVLGVLLPWLWLGFRKSRRLKAFSAGLADTLQLIAGSLQAGLSLAQAIDTVVKEGNEPIAGEFKRVLIESRLGVPLETSLNDVATRMGSKDFGWVVMAIKIQRQVGGNLAELLLTVGATLRERDYLRRQVDTLAAEGKLSAWVIGALPPLFVLYLLAVRRDYIMVLFTDLRGVVLVVGAALWLAIGAFWMSKIVKVEV